MSPRIYCLEATTACYRLYSFLYPPVLQWNARKQEFYTYGSHHPRYRAWIISISLIFLGCCCCGFAVTHANLFSLINVMFSGVVSTTGIFVCASALVMEIYVDDFVLAFGRMKRILDETDYTMDNHEQTSRDEWKKMGQILKLLQRCLLLIPIIIPPFGVYLTIDPYYCVYSYYLQPIFCKSSSPHESPDENSMCSLMNRFAFAFRYIWATVNLFEGVRYYSTCNTILCLWLEMQTTYLKILARNFQSKRFFQGYLQCQIALKTWERALSEWLRILLGTFFVMIVACNVGSVRYISVMPLTVYWFFPAVTVTDVLVIYNVFPHIMGCHEDTTLMLKQCKREGLEGRVKAGKWGNVNHKIHTRRLKSLRPIPLKCGDSFILKTETKSTFYDAIVGRTVDGILL